MSAAFFALFRTEHQCWLECDNFKVEKLQRHLVTFGPCARICKLLGSKDIDSLESAPGLLKSLQIGDL